MATDACGNADSTQATFEVVDTTLPVPTLTAPHDTTLYAGTTCYVDTTTLAIGEAVGSATDNCDAAPVSTITYSDASPVLVMVATPSLGLGKSFLLMPAASPTARPHCRM